MAITTININKEGQKNTVADYSSWICTHQLSMIKDKGLKYIPRVAENEICNRREIMQAACK